MAENPGATVTRSGNQDIKVIVEKGDTKPVLQVGSGTATRNGAEIPIDSPAFIQNGRTDCPLRVICEALGAAVQWDSTNRQISITV